MIKRKGKVSDTQEENMTNKLFKQNVLQLQFPAKENLGPPDVKQGGLASSHTRASENHMLKENHGLVMVCGWYAKKRLCRFHFLHFVNALTSLKTYPTQPNVDKTLPNIQSAPAHNIQDTITNPHKHLQSPPPAR